MHLFINNIPVHIQNFSEDDIRSLNHFYGEHKNNAQALILSNPDHKAFLKSIAQMEEQDFAYDYMLVKTIRPIQFIDTLKTSYQYIEAAGGLILHDEQIMLIYRNGVWDLPKGKIDKNESPENAAVREVFEECNVKTEIIKKLSPTFHNYTLNDKKILKKTHWFLMTTSDPDRIKPQREEGITEVKWVNINNLRLYLSNSYHSIRWVCSQLSDI